MKKFLIVLSVLFLFSSAVKAQNYTLEATNSSNSFVSSYSGQTSSFGESFCSGVSDFMNPSSVNTVFPSAVAASAVSSSGVTSLDPYLIVINGNRYMMIKDNNDGVFDTKDILGINDAKNNIFASLKPLDIDGDNKLTGEELSNAGIRFVKINQNGKLIYDDKSQDFKNSDIVFIHLSEIRKAYKNNGNTGNFGYYDVVIKNAKGEKRLVTGIVTFEKKSEILKYFG